MALAPTGVEIVSSTTSSISMSWIDPNSPDVYIRPYSKISTGSLWTEHATLPPGTTTYVFLDLIPGREYDVGVSTWDDPVESYIVSASNIQTSLTSAFTGSLAVEIWYAFTTTPVERQGVYIGANEGSPHLSLAPITGSPIELYDGDIWYSSSITPNGNLYIGQKSYADDQIHTWRFVTSRVDETSIAAVLQRWTTADAPTDLYVGANAFISDNPFTVVNTTSSMGGLIKNETWGAGFYMPDSDTVAVLGTADFFIPSGSLIIETGSLIFHGDGAMFDISGSGISASIHGQSIVSVLTGSTDTPLAIDPIDGTLYVNTASLDVSLRANDSYYTFGGGLPAIVDGGTY